MQPLSTEEIKSTLDKEIFSLLGETADEIGINCYVVGGFVRDLFLRRPTNDIDVVVVGSGIVMAQKFAARLKGRCHLSVFRNFGTAQVKWRGQEIEFVGARRESYSHDSRKPIVEDGTLEDDQNRRDFTINAMAICLNKAHFGELVDPFDGLLDLEDGIVRTPLDPDETYSDDPQRMLRCERFATQLKYIIEDETFEALSRNAERLKIISAERIIGELNKIMAADTPSRGFVDLQRSGLLREFLPELSALDVVESHNGRKHKNNFYHTLEVLDNVAKHSENLWLRWAALLHDIGKQRSKKWDAQIGWTFHNHDYYGEKMIVPLFRRLKLPLDERMKFVKKMVGLHMRPIAIADDIVTDSAIRRLLFDAGDSIDDLMLLCEADVTSKNEERKRGFLQNFKTVREKLVMIEEKDRIRNFQPPVSGDEIMQMFHLQPCPAVGAIKSALKDAVLDGKVPNEREAALDFVIKKGLSLGLTLVDGETNPHY